jgi:hypothetical protein
MAMPFAENFRTNVVWWVSRMLSFTIGLIKTKAVTLFGSLSVSNMK